MDECDGWMNRWMHGYIMNGWMNKWMEGWING